jgi:hypothetical protein
MTRLPVYMTLVWIWHSSVSKSHFVCECRTLRVEITLERVEITLLRVENTLCVLFWKIKRVLAKIYLKIDTHACEFQTQMCHFHTFACRIFSSLEELFVEKLSGEEFYGEDFSEVSVRSALKLGRFVVQYMSFLLNHVTERMDIWRAHRNRLETIFVKY